VNDLLRLKFWEELALQLASLWKTFWHAIKTIFYETIDDRRYYSYQNNSPILAPLRLSSTQREIYGTTILQTAVNKKLLNINNGGELIQQSIDYLKINVIKIRRVGGVVDVLSKIAWERGNVAPHYNKKTFRRYNYLLYTIQCIIGYQKINMATLRRVGGVVGAVSKIARQPMLSPLHRQNISPT
jgi:hypothetical protein